MTDVFISYKREDRDSAEHAARALAAHGYDVWWDAGLMPGEEFLREINAVIDRTKIGVVLWSNAALGSRYVRAEAQRLFEEDKYLSATLDPGMSLPVPFNSDQAADLSGGLNSETLSPLIAAIERRIGAPSFDKATSGEERLEHSEIETAFYSAIASSRHVEDFRLYLRRWPNGNFAALARSQIERLDNWRSKLGRWGGRFILFGGAAGGVASGVAALMGAFDAPPSDRALAQENTRLRGEIQSHAQDIAQLESEKERALAEHRESATALSSLRDRLTAALNEKEQIEATLQAAQDEKARLENALQTALADLRGTKTALAGTQESLGTSGEETKELRAQLKAANSALEQLQERSSAEIDTLSQRIADFQQSIANLTPRVKPASQRTSTIADRRHGEIFRDAPNLPGMVVIPARTFLMGSPESEESRDSDEGPQKRITVAKFAMGLTEVTFDQWQVCVDGGGCSNNKAPSDSGWGRGDRPVINVSWTDAQDYIAWINSVVEPEYRSGPYRLPSEAEWEYAARAGTTTPFWTGETISTDQANYNGNYTYGSGSQGVFRAKTVPVGSLNAPNPFGLLDVHGNVWEWIQDCYAPDLSETPPDGSAHSKQSCAQRVLRGGSWDNGPWGLRSALRIRVVPGFRFRYIGFRLSRTLTP